jgi:hypothetical protein
MNEPSSTEAIKAFIASCEMGASVAQVAEAVELSVSRTRELLNKEVRQGELDKAPLEPESKTMVYFIADKEKKPARKKRTPRNKGGISASAGKGNPDAKKIINPQPTLDLKKRVIRHAGGKMEWQNRQWEITVKDEDFKFSSRDLAKMTVGDLAKKVGISLPMAQPSESN